METQEICPHAYYAASVEEFGVARPVEILGALTTRSEFAVEEGQRDAWLRQIELLQPILRRIPGWVFFEYVVPRIGSRIDVAVVTGPVVMVLEFKAGESAFRREAIHQVWDYALDLKNFHLASHGAAVIPILVPTEATETDMALPEPHADGVFSPLRASPAGLRHLLGLILTNAQGMPLDPVAWGKAGYRPTPTIIAAAQALYAQHTVEAIARNDAGSKNLAATSARVEELIEDARSNGGRSIVFVTGVPGAGKTLVGLNVATKRREQAQATHAVFLSGNGPLVKVLREALTRDELRRLRLRGVTKRKGEVGQPVKAFIQNVHHFRDAGLREEGPPSDHVVIFDEAQRAWNLEMTAGFMARKKKRPGFAQSEPEFLISYLDRHRDWAVVVCLVGGGQEINRGEAGIAAWLDAIREKFAAWRVYVSPQLTDSEYAAGHVIDSLAGRPGVVFDEALHLAVSMRSFRAENVSAFVKALLDNEAGRARELLQRVHERYPIVLTRDLKRAKAWIRKKARGSERFGLVTSSAAQRLKPHAIDVRVEIDPVPWFLNDSEDPRSSTYLEDAASEFQVQGLELDWVCVAWDADFRFTGSTWGFNSFVGDRWQSIRKPDRQQFLKNAYRVLLTRARQGMAIFVPEGDGDDHTRKAAFYDGTYDYLRQVGVPTI